MILTEHVAPIVHIHTDSESDTVSIKFLKSKAITKVKNIAKKAVKVVTSASVKAKTTSKAVAVVPAKIVAESASEEASDSEQDEVKDEGSDSDVGDFEYANEEEFVAEVPRIFTKKVIESDGEESPYDPMDVEMKGASEESDTGYISEVKPARRTLKPSRPRVEASDSEDSMPDAPRRYVLDAAARSRDHGLDEAIADALVSIPLEHRSRRSSMASWSSGQDLHVPDSEEDDDDADVPAKPSAPAKKKLHKVSAAAQKKADLEKPQVRPAGTGTDIKAEKKDATLSAASDAGAVRTEESWHSSARIIYPAPGKKDILLNSQSEAMQAVLRIGIRNSKTSLLFTESYPTILSRSGFTRTFLITAATQHGSEAVHIKQRLETDTKYATAFADILMDRINILRGDVKRVSTNIAPGHYQFAGLSPAKTKELVEKLLKDHRYIFPTDPLTQRLQTEKPFHHPAMRAVIKEAVFNRNFRATNMDLFVSTSKKHPDDLELPDPMVALAGTAIYATLMEYRATGERQTIAFTEGAYEDTYRNHMKTLSDTRLAAPVALHKVLHGLFTAVTLVSCCLHFSSLISCCW
ncbi:hypothetical protein C8J57DRAFT_1353887 [Mycena rebaudengoi]|nr:hypothetical protein C8J57DRAFT_1353887 [Mycena rebaudengoi]